MCANKTLSLNYQFNLKLRSTRVLIHRSLRCWRGSSYENALSLVLTSYPEAALASLLLPLSVRQVCHTNAVAKQANAQQLKCTVFNCTFLRLILQPIHLYSFAVLLPAMSCEVCSGSYSVGVTDLPNCATSQTCESSQTYCAVAYAVDGNSLVLEKK